MAKRSAEYKTALELMGQQVVVHKKLERDHDYRTHKVQWVEVDVEERTGWVVGIRWKQVGVIVPGSPYGAGLFDEYDSEPTYFRQEARVPCLLVACWPTENPYLVPFDGFYRATELDAPPAPVTGDAVWTEADRELLRREAAAQPRDRLGRFLSVRTKQQPVEITKK